MFETKNLKILSFNMNDKKKVLDRIELILKIHRFTGILFLAKRAIPIIECPFIL
jgi:hypothetical protein